MGVYMVTYDLNKVGKNYDGLIEAIKAYGSYCKPQKSAWFIDTKDTAAQIRDNLSKQIDKDDDLFIGELRKHWAGSKNMKCVEWLKKPKRTWA